MPPYIGKGLVTECHPAAQLSASLWLRPWRGSRSSLSLCLGVGYFVKCICPLDRHIQGICPRLASNTFVERGFAWCGWWRPCVAGITPVSSLCRSCRAPATFNKAMVKGFRHPRWLGPSVEKISAGCWHSRLFGQSRPPRPDVALIPGASPGRSLYPWPTQIVIPTTLAPKTGEVSWESMGLR
jgi:hypothetical protein